MVLAGVREHSELQVETKEVLTISTVEARARADMYQRYHIETDETDDLWKIPRRFNVKVGKFGLAKLIFSEFFERDRK